MPDAHPVGHLPPILRAERQLVGALAAADAHTAGALALVADTIATLREAGKPYQVTHGLIDYAEVLLGEGADGSDALAQARQIADGLRCPSLLERADAMSVTREWSSVCSSFFDTPDPMTAVIEDVRLGLPSSAGPKRGQDLSLPRLAPQSVGGSREPRFFSWGPAPRKSREAPNMAAGSGRPSAASRGTACLRSLVPGSPASACRS